MPMLYQIATFLLDVIGGLIAGACLLRLYMQLHKVSFSNPVGGLVFALTDWLVMPLRKVITPLTAIKLCAWDFISNSRPISKSAFHSAIWFSIHQK